MKELSRETTEKERRRSPSARTLRAGVVPASESLDARGSGLSPFIAAHRCSTFASGRGAALIWRLLGRCTMNWAVQACFVTIAFEESRQTSGLSRPHALSVALQSAEKFPWNVLGAC